MQSAPNDKLDLNMQSQEGQYIGEAYQDQNPANFHLSNSI